ncbi:hypothetical protein EJB05_39851 [Eragrostis curvula]|uniref:Programmed cell death protein 2 C-terminal domain-containing protein n=1 Tax=Eragrostis curvula TaxID=38414 RepID=A0A5J9TYF8_9POAL|nr:hypothetical protein EJB05_39851 [Eragrostis curvula]
MAEEVHLGLPGPWAEDYREKADHYTTKIGGLPDWPTGDMGLKPELLQCSLCGTKLCLVAQVYAPVEKLNIEERTIYVLVCPTPNWKVLRAQKFHSGMKVDVSGNELGQSNESSTNSSEKQNDQSNMPSLTSFSEEQNDEPKSPEIDDDDFDLDALAEALEQAATLASNSKKQNKPKRANTPIKHPVINKGSDLSTPVLPCFYICYDKERYGGKGSVGSSSNELVLSKEIMDIANDEEEKWEGEKYEYDKAIGADRNFLKFKKRLDAHPQQCFRYAYGGKPLSPAAKLQEAGICGLCGSQRQYEMQLMSPLSYFLHEAGNGSSNYAPDSWTWLTLIIYTCSKSCSPSSGGQGRPSCCWGVVEEEILIHEDDAH